MHRDSSFSSAYNNGFNTSNYFNNNRASDLELRLQDLASRREVLEKRTKEKQQLLEGFSSARHESLTRLVSSFQEQNEQARQRNLQLLQDVVVTIHQSSKKTAAVLSSDLSNNNNTASNNTTKSQLLAAKKSYLKTLEHALPLAHRQEAIRLEEKMKNIKMEKIQSMQRREKLRQELVREERVRYELETQRQELVQTLALEQSDLLRSKASSLLIAEEGKLADREAVEHIARMGQQLSASIEQRLIEKQNAGIFPHFAPDAASVSVSIPSYPATDIFKNDFDSRKQEVNVSDVPITSRQPPVDVKSTIPKKQVRYDEAPTVSSSPVHSQRHADNVTTTMAVKLDDKIAEKTTESHGNSKKSSEESNKSSAMLPSPALRSSTEVRSFADYYEQQHYDHSDEDEEDIDSKHEEEYKQQAKESPREQVVPPTPPSKPQRSQRETPVQSSKESEHKTEMLEKKSSPRNNNKSEPTPSIAESKPPVVTSKLANIERLARSNLQQDEEEVDEFDISVTSTVVNNNHNNKGNVNSSRVLEDSDEFGTNSSGISNNIVATSNNNNSTITSPPVKPPRKPSITQEDIDISHINSNKKNNDNDINDAMLPDVGKIPIEHVIKLLFPSANASISKDDTKPYLLSMIFQQHQDHKVHDLQDIYNQDNIFPSEPILNGGLTGNLKSAIKKAMYLVQLLLQAHGLPSYSTSVTTASTENLNALSERFSSEVYGNALLLLLAYHGASLVPKDCVTGVVTLEKLKKELKKMSQQGGLQALVWWEELMRHGQQLVHSTPSKKTSKKPPAKPPKRQAFNSYINDDEDDDDEFYNDSTVNTDQSVHMSMNADYLAKVFTRALVDYVHPSALNVVLQKHSDANTNKSVQKVSLEDYERMKRKIYNVLQLELLSSPASHVSNSSSAANNPLRFSNESLPSPQRTTQPNSAFSPDKSFSNINSKYTSTTHNNINASDKPIMSSSIEKERQRTTTKPFWMDEDEIASDEEWEKPPVVKDLDAELNAKSHQPAVNKSINKASSAPKQRVPQDDEDVFDF